MTKGYQKSIRFSRVKRRKIEVNFDGGEITSDGGIVLTRAIDKKLNLTRKISQVVDDWRCQGRCHHSLLTLIRQRVYGLIAGYEDLNDHTMLRHDTAFQTGVEQDSPLGSASTLCRLEQRADEATMFQMHSVLVDQFIASYDKPPRRLILDFDATDDPVHGEQVGRYFSRYYDHYCFLPLYVFCGKQLLVSYLRPASRGAAFHAGAVLKLLVERLRQAWPRVQIIFRADSGFAIPRILGWCDRNGIDYLVGIGQNSRLLDASASLRVLAKTLYTIENKKQKLFSQFHYAARSWKKRQRKIIVKAEHGECGANPRFLITSLNQTPEYLYNTLYCARGDMENRIKEQQFLFSDRTSCHEWWPNQFRQLLSAVAYTLMEAMRRLALKGTELANAQVDTIRRKLIKIGGVVLRNTKKIKLMLSSAYPYQKLFSDVASALDSS